MSPCGVINRCAELFRSESKTQVYAVLHDLLARNERLFDNLSKCCTTNCTQDVRGNHNKQEGACYSSANTIFLK